MDQFKWFQTISIVYFACMLMGLIIYPLMSKILPQKLLPTFKKIVSIRGRDFVRNILYQVFRFMQNFFTFMSGYVASNCFMNFASRKMLKNFSSKRMSLISKAFYSMRNVNRFLVSPIFIKTLWEDCMKFKFTKSFNFQFLLFILGAFGDVFNIFFCLGENFATIYKVIKN